MNRLSSLPILIALCSSLYSQTAHVASPDANQILSEEVVISGTTTLDSQQLDEISSSLTARRMGDDEKEVTERIRDAFLQRGYLRAEVTNVKIRPLDPLARPKRVRIEADVAEGVRCKVAEISFSGNQGISADELRASFPIKIGEFFSVGKVRSGLESIRKQYASKGYLDFYVVPNTRTMNGAEVGMLFDIAEGPQYRMGELELVGKSAPVDELRQHWNLKPGDAFDAYYLEKFLDENSNLLPTDFSARNDSFMVRDCKHQTVTVRIELDPKRPWAPRPKDIGCDIGQDSSKPTGE
jgi:outer membrane protein assembly factor BamA